MAIKLEAGSKASYISKRYIRVVEATTLYQNEDIRLGSKDEAETASYISRTRMDSQKEDEEPQDDDTISDYALSYLMDGMEE